MKKYLQVNFLVILISLFVLSLTTAQAKEIKIKGRIVDSMTLIPVKMAIISIADNNSSIIFTGIVESDSANFEFDKIKIDNKIDKSRFQVTISNSGYFSKKVSFDPQSTSSELNLGTIALQPLEIYANIDAVVISANRTQVSVDKTTYVVDSMLLKNVFTTTDLMRNVPEISVDELQRKIKIMGKENTLVLLNGINTGSSVDIRTVDFRDIERIEVITLPSSGTDVQHDGVINIVLRPKIRKGFTIDLEETIKLDGRSNDTYLGLMWGSDKIRLKFTYDNYYRANPFNIEQQRTDQTTDQVYSKEGLCAKPFEISNNFGLNMDYNITPRDFFNITTYTQLARSAKDVAYSAHQIIDGEQTELSPFNTFSANDYLLGNYTLFYRHSMKNKPKDYLSINLNVGFMTGTEDVNSRYESDNTNYYNHEQANKLSSNLKIEYNNVLSRTFNLNAGAQGYFQDFRSSLNELPDKNNLKNYRYNIYADVSAYVKKFQFKIGANAEVNTNVFENKAYGSSNQVSFRPSAAVIFKINDHHTLKAEYRNPSYHPSAWMMAPYELRVDQNTIYRGNPDLKLTRYNVVEMTYTYRREGIMLNAIPYYQTSNNMVISQTVSNDDLSTVLTFVNGGRQQRAGLRINGSLNFLGGAISIDPDISIAYENMGFNGVMRQNFYHRFGGSVTLFFPLGFGCGAYGSYRGTALTTTGYTDPVYSLDAIFVLKRFEKLNLNLFFGYQSIVQSADVEYAINNNYEQRDYFKFNSKGFMLRLNYYFMARKASRMERVNTYFDNDRK